jgi:hypothetical protein
MGMFVISTLGSGLFLTDAGTWTRRRSAARSFSGRASAMRSLREVRRTIGLELRVDGPATPRRAFGARTPEQRRALELAQRYGALVRAGRYWVPAGLHAPHLEPVTISSLITRGDLKLTETGYDGHRHRRGLRAELAEEPTAGAAATEVAA